jgi:putative Ca2+/H+ antiporter (TMEM165/GDT1 family)
MKTFWLTFVTLFLAELGDKTQLSVISLTSKTKQPMWVYLGAVAGLAVVSLIGVLVGDALVRVVPETVIRRTAAVAFLIIGLLMFFNKI